MLLLRACQNNFESDSYIQYTSYGLFLREFKGPPPVSKKKFLNHTFKIVAY